MAAGCAVLQRDTTKLARAGKAHVLFKFQDPEFRQVTKDAANLFQHFGGDESDSGWDTGRQCRRKIRKTLDSFAGYPVQVLQLTEYCPKRKRNRTVTCWIVSTDLELTAEEIREAAHQRWQTENDVFKRISHLSGTKRFYFKDPRQFFNLLHIFFAALRAGIRGTWRNLFSRIQEVLYELPGAFVAVP